MSGHSHFRTIQHKKQAEDQKRGKIFSKFSRLISLAAKEGGDPETNFKLKQAIEAAKRFNMPKDNIERAIKRGTGEIEGEKLEEVVYEAFGPNGAVIIIEAITDNKNRTLGDIKQILQKHGGKLANEGSVKWLFEKKGIITIKGNQNKEELELIAIEAGAEETKWEGEFLEIHTKPEDLKKTKEALEQKDIEINSSSLGWIPKEEKQEQGNACQKLFEDLLENESVQEVYSNIEA